jgi:excisionase family DNA binding protein
MQTLFTTKEVAEILRVSPRTVQILRAAGELKPIKVRSRSIRYTQQEIERYIAEQAGMAAVA